MSRKQASEWYGGGSGLAIKVVEDGVLPCPVICGGNEILADAIGNKQNCLYASYSAILNVNPIIYASYSY
jgi:hypothetical protein